MDIGEGNIRITKNGVSGGGLSENETELNPKGYWIRGTSDQYNIIVEKEVKTELTLDNVDISCNPSMLDCLNVSHADVTVTLVGVNNLYSNAGTSADNLGAPGLGNAITKDGMDGTLTIQCEHVEKSGHKCSEGICGTLNANGNPTLFHAGGIGSSARHYNTAGEAGFCNLTIKGGHYKFAGRKTQSGNRICLPC